MSFSRIVLLAIAAIFLVVDPAFAAETKSPVFSEWGTVTGGLTIALAAFGGAMSQSKATSSALDAIARNPGASGQLFLPMILGLVFIESLVIYALVIAFFLVGTQ